MTKFSRLIPLAAQWRERCKAQDQYCRVCTPVPVHFGDFFYWAASGLHIHQYPYSTSKSVSYIYIHLVAFWLFNITTTVCNEIVIRTTKFYLCYDVAFWNCRSLPVAMFNLATTPRVHNGTLYRIHAFTILRIATLLCLLPMHSP